VGRTADGAWLMVRAASGACWVSAITLETCGDLSSVQVQEPAPPPPAPEGQPQEEPPVQTQPAAPGGLGVSEHVCQGTTYAVTLSWADAANNESGYRVYRNGALLGNLGAGATSYTDNPPQGGPYTYKVEAYNGFGASSASTNDSGCLL